MVDALTLAVLAYARDKRVTGNAYFVKTEKILGPQYRGGIMNRKRIYRSQRDYWNHRMSDFNEATSEDGTRL